MYTLYGKQKPYNTWMHIIIKLNVQSVHCTVCGHINVPILACLMCAVKLYFTWKRYPETTRIMNELSKICAWTRKNRINRVRDDVTSSIGLDKCTNKFPKNQQPTEQKSTESHINKKKEDINANGKWLENNEIEYI